MPDTSWSQHDSTWLRVTVDRSAMYTAPELFADAVPAFLQE
jgi:hypothetical protein